MHGGRGLYGLSQYVCPGCSGPACRECDKRFGVQRIQGAACIAEQHLPDLQKHAIFADRVEPAVSDCRAFWSRCLFFVKKGHGKARTSQGLIAGGLRACAAETRRCRFQLETSSKLPEDTAGSCG